MAYKFGMWGPDKISFEIEPESEGDILIVAITTPAGKIRICAEVELQERRLRLTGRHAESSLGANALGPAALRYIARAAMKRMNVDELEIAGAPRSTGANPGRTPATLRFRR